MELTFPPGRQVSITRIGEMVKAGTSAYRVNVRVFESKKFERDSALEKERAEFIKENCLRGNWAFCLWDTNADMFERKKVTESYFFTDEQDAIHFKLRFG